MKEPEDSALIDSDQVLSSLLGGGTQTAVTRSSTIISVGSGKGGVGKTNVAVNLALSYVAMGKRVILLDADLGLANVNILLGFFPKHNLYHLFKGQKSLEEILIKTQYGLDVVPGASGIAQLANLDKQQRYFLLQELAKLSFYDIVIIDVGAGISDYTMEFLRASDRILAIVTPEPTAIADVYGLIKVFSGEYSRKHSRVGVVVNRAKGPEQAKGVADKLVKVSSQFLNFHLDYLGFLVDDEIVKRAVFLQKPFYHLEPQHKVSLSVEAIAYDILGESKQRSGGLSSFLKSFLRLG